MAHAHELMTRLSSLSASVMDGFAQLGSLGQKRTVLPKRAPTAASALRGDWVKLGRDLHRAETRVRKMKRVK